MTQPYYAMGKLCCPYCLWRKPARRRSLGRYRRHLVREHARQPHQSVVSWL